MTRKLQEKLENVEKTYGNNPSTNLYQTIMETKRKLEIEELYRAKEAQVRAGI